MSGPWVATALLGAYAILLTIGVLILVAPAIIAFQRDHPNRWLILVVCVFLGGTGIGWGVALVWALNAAHWPRAGDGAAGGESGLNLFANDRVRTAASDEAVWSGAGQKMRVAPSLADVLQQIERLEKLKVAGHIDEVEFATLKAAALDRL